MGFEVILQEIAAEKTGDAERAGNAQLDVAARSYAIERSCQQIALGSHAFGVLVDSWAYGVATRERPRPW